MNLKTVLYVIFFYIVNISMLLVIAVKSFPLLRKLLSYDVPRPQRVQRGSIIGNPSLPRQGVCLLLFFFHFVSSLHFLHKRFHLCCYASIKPPHPQLCLSSHQGLDSFRLFASNSFMFVLKAMGSNVDK